MKRCLDFHGNRFCEFGWTQELSLSNFRYKFSTIRLLIQYITCFARCFEYQICLSFGPLGHYVSKDERVFHADEFLGTKMDRIQTLKISILSEIVTRWHCQILLPCKGVALFTYALGSGADTSVTRRLACENKGLEESCRSNGMSPVVNSALPGGIFYPLADGADLSTVPCSELEGTR